jgi:hypothetical protein
VAPFGDKRIHAWDFKEVRERYGVGTDTADAKDQEMIVRFLEPTGARGPEEPTGTHFFGLHFWPKAVKKMMTWQRMRYLERLDDDTIPFQYEICHRSFGKTVWGIIFCARELAVRNRRFILFTSSEYKIASRRTEAIRAFFQSKQCRDIFGAVQPRRYEKATAAFGEEAFFLMDPESNTPFACVSPRGAGQVVNGSIAPLGSDMARVDLIFNDDGQSRKNIWNDSVRERYNEWIEAELFNTVETDEQPEAPHYRWPKPKKGERPRWKIVELDTIKHPLAHIYTLVDKPEWHGDIFPMAEKVGEGKFRSLTALMTDGQVQSLYERNKHRPDYFAREFLCQPGSSEKAAYSKEMFRYYRDEDLVKERRPLIKFAVIDPARIGHARANKTSILFVGVDVEKPAIYFRHNTVDNLEPEDYYQLTFLLCRQFGTTEINVEETGLSGVIRNAFQQAASLAGLGGKIDFEWLNSKRAAGPEYGPGDAGVKVARAGALLPYYRQGVIYHDESMRGGSLERALIEYPDCREFDATDTGGYVPEILERKGIYLEGVDLGDDLVLDDDEQGEYEEALAFFESGRWCA